MKIQGSSNQTVNSSIATFNIPHVRVSDEGFYLCQIEKRVSNETFRTLISDPIKLTGKPFVSYSLKQLLT